MRERRGEYFGVGAVLCVPLPGGAEGKNTGASVSAGRHDNAAPPVLASRGPFENGFPDGGGGSGVTPLTRCFDIYTCVRKRTDRLLRHPLTANLK